MAIAAVRAFVCMHCLWWQRAPCDSQRVEEVWSLQAHTHVTPVYGFIVLHHRQWSLSSIKQIIICTSVTILHCTHTHTHPNAYAHKLHSSYLHLVIRRQKLTHTKPHQSDCSNKNFHGYIHQHFSLFIDDSMLSRSRFFSLHAFPFIHSSSPLISFSLLLHIFKFSNYTEWHGA